MSRREGLNSTTSLLRARAMMSSCRYRRVSKEREKDDASHRKRGDTSPRARSAPPIGGRVLDQVSSNSLLYLTADTLGSTRLTTDGSGVAQECNDYFPFGEDIQQGIGGRGSCFPTGMYPNNPDIESIKFTGKERDAETGMDFFGARYFSGAQGRFTSPDWSSSPQPIPYADLTDPQTLNLYGYIRNNPLSKADPDGHCGLFGDNPCSSLAQFISVLPDRIIGGLKGEANAFGAKFKASNAEQQEVMDNVKAIEPEFQTAVMMALPGPGGKAGEETVPLGDFHAPGDVPNGSVIVRGGQAEMPQPGEVFSGSQGATTAEAGRGVPHGTIRETTAGEIRANGGTVEVAPEPTRAGNTNYQHVNVTEGSPRLDLRNLILSQRRRELNEFGQQNHRVAKNRSLSRFLRRTTRFYRPAQG